MRFSLPPTHTLGPQDPPLPLRTPSCDLSTPIPSPAVVFEALNDLQPVPVPERATNIAGSKNKQPAQTLELGQGSATCPRAHLSPWPCSSLPLVLCGAEVVLAW